MPTPRAFASALVLVLAPILRAQEDPLEEGIAAIINRDVIAKSEVWARITEKGRALPDDPRVRRLMYESGLLQILMEKAIDQASQKANLEVKSRQVRSVIEDQKEAWGGEEEFRGYLAERGLTLEEYEDVIDQALVRRTYLAVEAGNAGPLSLDLRPRYDNTPSPREIEEYYRQNRDTEFTEKDSALVRAMAIFAEEGDFEKARALADEIVMKLRRTKADFAVLAERHSREYNPEKGGELGWIERVNPYPDFITEFAFSAKSGDVSDPIRFRRGFVIVKLEDRRTERTLTFLEAQPKISQVLREKKARIAETRILRRALLEASIWPPELKRRVREELTAQKP